MIELKLKKGNKIAYIDDIDADLASLTWTHTKSYPCKGKKKLHNIIALRIFGSIPHNMLVDHIDGNPLNNIRANLRLATPNDNMRNRKLQANNSSGYPGVYWYKPYSKWRAKIKVNGKYKHIGHFTSKEDAISARMQAEDQYFGAFARKHKPCQEISSSPAMTKMSLDKQKA